MLRLPEAAGGTFSEDCFHSILLEGREGGGADVDSKRTPADRLVGIEEWV